MVEYTAQQVKPFATTVKRKATSKHFVEVKVPLLAETTEIQDGVHSLVTSESAEESDNNSFLGMIHENKSNPWVIDSVGQVTL